MAQPLNRYKADLREIRFLLFEQFQLQQLLGDGPFAEWGEDEVRMVLDEVYKFACEVSGPINQIGDRTGCKLVDGRVVMPEGYRDAWKKLYEAGWNQLEGEPELGGQNAPLTLQNIADELISGSNTSFQMYPGLTLSRDCKRSRRRSERGDVTNQGTRRPVERVGFVCPGTKP